MFEAMSSLKINFLKSEVLIVIEDDTKYNFYAEMFNCKTGSWPIKYLGVPVSGSKLLVADLDPLHEKLGKHLDGWKGKNSSIGGRYVLI